MTQTFALPGDKIIFFVYAEQLTRFTRSYIKLEKLPILLVFPNRLKNLRACIAVGLYTPILLRQTLQPYT